MRPDQRELDDEIRGHLALDIQRRVERGDDPASARVAALAELGYLADVRESMRRVWYTRLFDLLQGVRRDCRYGVRVLRKSPGFSCVAILTLALAIGANGVVFGALNGVLLRPLTVPDPESLYGVEYGLHPNASAREHSMYESYPDYVDLRDRNRTFDALAGFSIASVGLDMGDETTTAWADEVTGNYFDALRLQPYLGRLFHAADEHGPNSAPYIVLSYRYWQRQFAGDPSVIGRTVRLNTYPFTIVGVTAPAFHGMLAIGSPNMFVPFVQEEQIEGRALLNTRATQTLFMTFGHLKPGITPAQAAADLDSIGAYLERTFPREHGATTFELARPGLYGSYLGQPMRAFMTGLLLLSGLILLAACANLGGLFAARTSDRAREIAVRLSLGASRAHVLRQLVIETLLLSLAGGGLGLWGSTGMLRALTTWQPMPKFPVAVPVDPDARVYFVSLALAVASGLVLGLLPARQIFRTDPYRTIKGATSTRAGSRWALRDLLLASQIAICAVLVTASIVATRGLIRATSANVGFDPKQALLAETDLSMGRYTGDRLLAMQKRMIETMAALPGVAHAAAIGRPPLSASGFLSYVYAEQATDFTLSKAVAAAERFQVSPGYFEAARTALVAGRDFTWHDDAAAPRVAIVNRELARRLFGSLESAEGRRFRLRNGTLVQVVGIAEDGKYTSVMEDPEPALFVPLRQMPMAEMALIIATVGDPQALAGSVRTALRGIDPSLPVDVMTWTRALDFALFAPRMISLTLGVMGAMGALLAITGIFGTAAYTVSKRLKEFGIRVALGARGREIVSAAVGRAVRLLAWGSLAGVVLALLSSRVMAAVAYSGTARDPLVLGGVVFIMVMLGAVGTWIPARRATHVDPLILLREE